MVCSAIAKFCSSLYKDTDAIISRNESFFSSLKDIEQVVSIGLSFGNVDTPYLLRIAEEIKPTSKWIIYYYMLHEDIERQAVRRMMRQAHKEQQTFQKKKSEQER